MRIDIGKSLLIVHFCNVISDLQHQLVREGNSTMYATQTQKLSTSQVVVPGEISLTKTYHSGYAPALIHNKRKMVLCG